MEEKKADWISPGAWKAAGGVVEVIKPYIHPAVLAQSKLKAKPYMAMQPKTDIPQPLPAPPAPAYVPGNTQSQYHLLQSINSMEKSLEEMTDKKDEKYLALNATKESLLNFFRSEQDGK